MGSRSPWFKFDWADWLLDDSLSAVSVAARGLWIDLICRMYRAESDTIHAEPGQVAAWSRLSGGVQEASELLEELRRAGVGEVVQNEETGAYRITSPRVTRELAERRGEAERKRSERTNRPARPKRADSEPCPDDVQICPDLSEVVRDCPPQNKKESKREKEKKNSPPTPSRSEPKPATEPPPPPRRAPHAGESDGHGIPPERLHQLPAYRAAFAAIEAAYPGPKTARTRQARQIGCAASELALGHDPPLTIADALAAIQARVVAFGASPETRRRERQFIPSLTRWLEDGHWRVEEHEWAAEATGPQRQVNFDQIFGATG